MKYTKDDLAKMSDFEINTALLDVANIKWQVSAVDDEVAMINSCRDVFDFNDWGSIMPLAVEHKISLNQESCFGDWSDDDSGEWTASESIAGNYLWEVDASGNSFSHISPQRAIACCLILVLQEREA